MQLLGHRGARGEAPENTVAGFIYAKNLGLTGLEFDVQLSKDEKLVVIHDSTVDRTTNGSGNVADFTSDELANLDARAGFEDYSLPCGVPTLDEVLDVVSDVPLMQIEIKTDAPERLERVAPLLLEAIEQRKMIDQVIITSFDPQALEIWQQVAPDYPLWSLLGAFDSVEWLDRALGLNCRQINVSLQKAETEVVRKARKLGLKVSAWACRTDADFARAQELEVEAFTHDFPSRILPLLEG